MARGPERWLACVALLAACGAPRVEPPPYALVRNGGAGPHVAGCEEVALHLADDAVRTLAAPAPDCGVAAENLGTSVSAAYAYVQTATSAVLAGPIVSNRVELRLLPSLLAGSDARALASAASARELDTGASQRELATGSQARELATGSQARELSGGGGERALATGGSARAIATSASHRALATGATTRELDTGESARALAAGANSVSALSLRKSVDPQAVHAGETASFALTFVNDGSSRLDRIVLVDRVDPWLRVTEAPGARAYVLEDRSTLIVWDDREPLAAGRERTYVVRAVARARLEEP